MRHPSNISADPLSPRKGRESHTKGGGPKVQLTTDAHRAYLEAVEESFGADVDYAQLVKLYGAAPESAKGRYSPAECVGIRKHRIEGSPDPKHVSTSYVERQYRTMPKIG